MEHYKYFGLKLEPFSNTPDNRFYFNSDQHAAAMAKLLYISKAMKGLAVLIGDVGTGKTTLARKLLMSLPESEYESSMLVIIHSGITADWLLSKIATQLGVEDPDEDKIKLLGQLYNRLVEIHDRGKTAVILVDEAQMLRNREIMEEFRGLLNLEIPGKKFISFIFFGLPDLEDNLKKDEPLNQRVALRYRLDCMNLKSTENYIKHRLRVAGANRMLFTNEAVMSIQKYSRGVPRLINTICDNSLLEGMLLNAKVIDRKIVEKAASELGLEPATNEELRQIETLKVSPPNMQPSIEKSKEPISTDVSSLNASSEVGTEPSLVKEGGEDRVDIEKDTEIDRLLDNWTSNE